MLGLLLLLGLPAAVVGVGVVPLRARAIGAWSCRLAARALVAALPPGLAAGLSAGLSGSGCARCRRARRVTCGTAAEPAQRVPKERLVGRRPVVVHFLPETVLRRQVLGAIASGGTVMTQACAICTSGDSCRSGLCNYLQHN